MTSFLPKLMLKEMKINNLEIKLENSSTYSIILCVAMDLCVLERISDKKFKFLTEIGLPYKTEDFIFAGSQEFCKLIIHNLVNFESCDPILNDLGNKLWAIAYWEGTIF